MILWEEKSLQPEGYISVTYTLKGERGANSRVKSILTVNSLVRELPYLEKPVFSVLPWKRDNYERWARVKPSPAEWGVLTRPTPQHAGGNLGQHHGSYDKPCWSVVQVMKPKKDVEARSTPEIVVQPADIDCNSLDGIIQFYAELESGRLRSSSDK